MPLVSTIVLRRGLRMGLLSGEGNFPWGSMTMGSSGEEIGMDEVPGEIDMGASGDSELQLEVLAGTGRGEAVE